MVILKDYGWKEGGRGKKDYIQLFRVKSSSVFVREISLNFCIWGEKEHSCQGDFYPRGMWM